MKDLVINEELKNLLPPLSAEEFAGLEESILKDGCLSPLVEWNGILVDGHHRYEICTKHQVPFAVKSVVLDSLDDAKLWIWKHQENRRNLTPYHRAEIALKLKEAIAAKAKERQVRKPADSVPANLPEQKETREELAELAGMSPRSLAKAEFIAEHADEDTKEKLRHGVKGTSIDKEYKRLKEEEKTESDVSNTSVEPVAEQDAPPAHPNKDVKFVPRTTLKLIPQDSPRVLLVNLFELFREGFVEDMVVMAVEMLLEERGKETVKSLLAELNKKYGRK
ncbi:MAG TPA: hypothetical protein DEB39_01900 [Planctomycetaceae bacterium]|nr:hypothetical protein [Planctomycetaceae bacterium]